ncbi:ABC transporter substrate-binding protein [Pantoea cypripedii]|uniref:Ethanolamine utilization protein EutN n=1 Tax=Pantoea cypripedii TaxID=55209 RepID=A0A1X1ES02_PANCY|nr:ABC transporter substrate-binding protein [Pantoea cypripedii]MBP2196819.1 branched-chain amino acid transport system substrate-binding protein [Pantoea cypripedii]ORM92778.1 ethanolamine utilization protein EutN [Pantoea cypripedii]
MSGKSLLKNWRKCAVVTVMTMMSAAAIAADPIKVGLVTALSGQSAKSGEALTRGLTIAINEINAAGGVKGHPLELVRRDDESNPGKGMLAARELIQREKVAVLFGGLDTPVSLAIVPLANQLKTPFVGLWAAGTGITHNGAKQNYVFRVSAVDELVDEALVEYASEKKGMKKAGMILVNNPWGESNEKGFRAALQKNNIPVAGVERIEDSDVDLVPQLTRLKNDGANTLLMVGNVGPSAQVVKSLHKMNWQVPVVSHWGPAGGRFSELAGPGADQVTFIQTFVFTDHNSAKGNQVMDELKKQYPQIKGLADVTPAVGIANAYDAMHLTAMALNNASSLDGTAIRDGFYAIKDYDGLIKHYQQPFTVQQHDALGPKDYVFAQFKGEQILPVTE